MGEMGTCAICAAASAASMSCFAVSTSAPTACVLPKNPLIESLRARFASALVVISATRSAASAAASSAACASSSGSRPLEAIVIELAWVRVENLQPNQSQRTSQRVCVTKWRRSGAGGKSAVTSGVRVARIRKGDKWVESRV